MNKYINLILLSIFGLLGLKLNFGLSLYIPFIYYYVYMNYKNIFLIMPLSIFSSYILGANNYLLFIIVFIPIIMSIFITNKKKLFILISSIIANILTVLIYNITNKTLGNNYLTIISVIISIMLMFYLIYIDKVNKNINIEILIALILVLSTVNYKIVNVDISFLIAIYYTMYFSSKKQILKSFVFSIFSSLYLYYFFSVSYTFIIIITSIVYYIPNIFSTLIYLVLGVYSYIIYSGFFNLEIYLLVTLIVLFFEIFRKFLIHEVVIEQTLNDLYISDTKQMEVELDTFSLFLDKINSNTNDNKYLDDINKKIEKLVSEYCFKCERRNECFQKNKGKLYFYFKSCILGNETDFICEHGENIRRYGRNLGNSLMNKKAYSEDLLKPIINGISSIMKQYKISKNENREIGIKKIIKLKQSLEDCGYTILLFNVLKNIDNDFIIEIGIEGIAFINEKKKLENICFKNLEIKTTVNQQYIKGNKTYVIAIPKNNYQVMYGYGSISKIGNSICGDNYLVKNMTNKKMIAIICDGMGKGINANVISANTLQLLDEITNTNMNSETCLHILNTLYYIQDYQESFSTIDFVEIDKHTGEMLLYKAGSAITYIIHNNNTIEKIENENLPFGLNEFVISKKIKLQDNDLVLLASDGIFDNILNIDDFERFIKSIKDIEPQKIAYEVLNYSRNTDVISKDDMSIIALKVKII